MHPLFIVAALGLGLNVAIVTALDSFDSVCLFWACCMAILAVFLDPCDTPPHELD
jgi:hypothetical protein